MHVPTCKGGSAGFLLRVTQEYFGDKAKRGEAAGSCSEVLTGVILPHGDMRQRLGVFLIVMAGGHRLVPLAAQWVEAGDAAKRLRCPGWTHAMRG